MQFACLNANRCLIVFIAVEIGSVRVDQSFPSICRENEIFPLAIIEFWHKIEWNRIQNGECHLVQHKFQSDTSKALACRRNKRPYKKQCIKMILLVNWN